MDNDMEKERSAKPMLVPSMIMGIIAISLLFIAYSRGEGEHLLGLRAAWKGGSGKCMLDAVLD